MPSRRPGPVGEPADLAEFLPPRDHPQYLAILCELIRVDLEYSWQDGRPHRLDSLPRPVPRAV